MNRIIRVAIREFLIRELDFVKKLRRIVLEKKGIKLITTLPSKVFKKVSANCIIFVLGRSNNKRGCSINLMLHDSDLSLLEKEEGFLVLFEIFS